ncbi:Gfo/Idh/MocA family oxidoreductase [Cryobacterium glaciale]|uniref:Gfo/Idh/MocA family oxidoreductase n=1 Tax=Cryobacterium glaciale TaxID=1259145 RepID=A0A4R8UZ09_9MICO|nr:Gfo/Idh/MocA family oxidoreductase [Cryobacterium glaciale]TFB74999.1 Gfo/Idh/MocA family oxidoreductase [Cryobacterium glaciale]
MRIIQVGLGFWGADWATVIAHSPHTELVALVDFDEAALQAVGDKLGVAPNLRFASLTDALKSVEADAALVVVPPHVHEKVALEALEAGLHCMIEKPFTTSIASSQRLIDAADRLGLTIMVTQSFRFRRGPRTVKRLIEEGALGRIETVFGRFRKDPAFTGFRLEMEEPLIVDLAIHHFDYIRGIFGLEPATVRARSFNPSWSRFDGNATAFVEFETVSGAMISYTGSWDSRRPHTSWDGTWEIHGSHASLLWEYNQILLFPHGNTIGETVFRLGALERADDVLEIPLDPVDEEERWGTVKEFVSSIKNGREPETSGMDNIRSLGVVYAAVESAKSDGAEVNLEEFVRRELNS